jgi:hypothetical protein
VRKEAIVAIGLGSILGLVLAFGIWSTNKALKKASDASSKPISEKQTQKIEQDQVDLTIVSPATNSVTTSQSINIQGISKANSLIPVYAEDKDYLFVADSSGNFTGDVEMGGGINNLIVGDKNLTVVYTASLGEPPAKNEQVEATDEIRQKVQEKLDIVASNPTAILGVVTDKTESGIQIRDAAGQIQQTATTAQTTFVRIGKTTTETNFDDLGIGDYVAVAGWSMANNGHIASRIIITQTPDIASRKILRGTVQTSTAREITFSHDGGTATIKSSDTPYVYEFTGNDTIRKKFADVDEGEEIYALGVLSDDYLDTRTIFIISPTSS